MTPAEKVMAEGWWDDLETRHRRRGVERWPAHLVGGELVSPHYAALPLYLRVPFGDLCSGPPLTTTVNSATIEPLERSIPVTTLQLNPLPEGVAEPAQAAPPHPVTTMVNQLLASNPDMATLTKVYLSLRDKKAELDAAAKLKVGPLTEGMGSIENHMLAKFNELGVDNVKTPHGTPYISTTTSITMADPDVFWKFVLAESLKALPVPDAAKGAVIKAILDSGALAMIEDRPAKSACEQYLETTQSLPPGLNSRTTRKLNVRK